MVELAGIGGQGQKFVESNGRLNICELPYRLTIEITKQQKNKTKDPMSFRNLDYVGWQKTHYTIPISVA